MTGPAGNSEFCFPSTSMFLSANIEGLGETKLTVSLGGSHCANRCFTQNGYEMYKDL